MKKSIMLCVFVSLFLCSWAIANDTMVITFDDGTSQTVNLERPSFSIRSINLHGDLHGSRHGRGIRVVAGTYGSNCGVSHGNKTSYLASECNGREQCEYVIDYTIIGDPAPGCSKDYIAEWQCGNDSTVRSTSASPEAGFKKRIVLSCPR